MMTSLPKGIRLLPIWMPLGVIVITALLNAGSVSASFGSRIGDSEKRVDAIERDRELRLREYEEFKVGIRGELSEIKTNVVWIRRTLEKGE